MRTNSFGRLSARGLGQWANLSDGWELVSTVSSANSIGEIAYGDGYFVMPSTDLSGEVYRSSDGVTWSTTTMSTVVRPRTFSYSGGYFLGFGTYTSGTTQMSSGDAGASFSYSNTINPAYAAGNGGSVWIAAVSNAFFYDVSLDNGSTWTNYAVPSGYKMYGVVYQGGTWTAAVRDTGGASYTMLSTDDGATWSSAYSQSWDAALIGRMQSNGSYLLAPKDTGTPGSSNLIKSTDNGVTWSDVATPYRFTNVCADGSTIVGNGGSRSYLSRDGGSSWTQLDDDLAVTFGGYSWIATDGSGVFVTFVWDPSAGANYILRYKI